MQPKKPTIVKVVQTELEERAPPNESEYDFIETFPKQAPRTKPGEPK